MESRPLTFSLRRTSDLRESPGLGVSCTPVGRSGPPVPRTGCLGGASQRARDVHVAADVSRYAMAAVCRPTLGGVLASDERRPEGGADLGVLDQHEPPWPFDPEPSATR